MKKLLILSIALGVISCKKDIETMSDLKSNFYELQSNPKHMGDELKVEFHENQEDIDSVVLTLNGKTFKNNQKLELNTAVFGSNELEINVYMAGNSIYGKTQLAVLNPEKELPIQYTVINRYPHPDDLFTQGFFFHNNKIYESSGQYEKSKLVNYTLGSNSFSKEVKLDPKIFAEGSCLMNGKWYILTYRERKVLVYNPDTFELIETLEMPTQLKEGWGLATNGTELLASDGSQNIYFFDEQLTYKRRIQVTGNISIYTYINEMEYINGKIYANIWQTPFILVINPETGAVEKYYDLKSINESSSADDVLNGIALHNGNLLLTGKNWKTIYEVNLPD